MGIALNDEIRRLLDGRHFAVLATINPDGGPQTSAMWVARDGDDVLFSTVAGRRKHRNLERDPRASVTVIDSADPYNYVELRGRVTAMDEDVGRAFDTGLSWKYDGRDPDPDRPGAKAEGISIDHAGEASLALTTSAELAVDFFGTTGQRSDRRDERGIHQRPRQ